MTTLFSVFPSPLFFHTRSARGFTLTEFMVAMTLGLLLIGGVIHVYVASFSSWRINDDLARIQENGRIAIGMLERDLRMAAFRGCAREDEGALSSALKDTAKTEWDRGFWVQEKAGSTAGELELVFRAPREGALKLSANVEEGKKDLLLENSAYSQAIKGGEDGDFFLVGDCGKSELFKGEKAQTTDTVKIERTDTFINTHDRNDTGVQVLALAKTVYAFEYDAARKHWVLMRDGAVLADVAVFRLCYAEEEAIGGKLASVYGKVDASNAGTINWDRVSSVQINLVLAAEATAAVDGNIANNPVLCDGAPAWAAGSVPQDTKLRKLLSTTVRLRNKSL
ncbi:MAG: PilW family protein [Zoogloeaceae bacterium]|jgi:type IV pilus assembly protein PilW|nr:PilW family protein [Zoogloeaceae bacterium]